MPRAPFIQGQAPAANQVSQVLAHLPQGQTPTADVSQATQVAREATMSQFDKALDKLSAAEKRAIVRGLKGQQAVRVHNHDWGDKHIRFGYCSDTHIGHKEFKEELWDKMGQFFKKEKVELVYHAGDILEGMSGREGHIYELRHIGITAQLNAAASLIRSADFHLMGILGNHDLWAMAKANMGINVGQTLEDNVPNFTHLGDWEADVKLAPHITLKLYHGNDGTAYATSYKLQKLVESFTGGEKPNLVMSGHYHKAMYAFMRNVHAFECGTLCGQTRWMRGKKIQAHLGFGLIELWLGKKGIVRLRHEFIPHYEE